MLEIAKKKNITIINNVKSELSAIYDETLISTVVRNLLANAIKFTHENESVTINAVKYDNEIIVIIEDNGVGIEAEFLESIFDKKSYDTRVGTNNEKGSGLGLKLCKEFIERHNGKIWAESKIGIGSKFLFSIPV